MKKFLFIVCILCVVMSTLSARTMKQLFTEMPDSLLPVLSRSERLDCVDYLASGMKASVKNNFGEQTTLVKLTTDFALLDISPVSFCEWKLLINGTDSVVCMVHTYLLPAAESRLMFYDMNWKPRTLANVLVMPCAKDFETLPAGSSKQAMDDCLSQSGTERIAATFSKSKTEDTLTFSLSMDDGNPDLRKSLSPYLKEKLEYVWQKGRFVPIM